MTDEPARGRALRPLWLMTTGGALAASATYFVAVPGNTWIHRALVFLGVVLVALTLNRTSSRWRGSTGVLWFAAGLALIGGRGLSATAVSNNWTSLASNPESTIRARVVVTDGWTESRWGWRSRVRVLDASLRDHDFRSVPNSRIEVRGSLNSADLPDPGAVIDVLARPAGDAKIPLLIVPSARLMLPTGSRRMLPSLRNRLASGLMSAAGTDVTRIRAAELAATLSLGRRDLVPQERRDTWRRSGFAHLLAVSGLHVGIVGGSVWLLAALVGAEPRSARLFALLAIPGYALLAGASPSAVRAALMGTIYLGARFLGRAVLPMAAVLLAVFVLLLFEPEMIANAGFQLTVLITAALVRWVPTVAAALRGPGWLTGAAAVPLVAQIAAAPVVAWHFRSLIPGAILSNFLALPLLAPTVLMSVIATLVAPVWQGGASLVLTALHHLFAILEFLGRPARAAELIAPGIPLTAAIVLTIAGWLALQTGRRAYGGSVVWIVVLLALNFRLVFSSPINNSQISVLPVSDGLAALVESRGEAVLADAGRFARQAAVLTADTGHRRLRALLASHTDEDHIGGGVYLLRTLQVDQLVMPVWMTSAKEVVPLLRAARSAGTRVVPVARGSTLTLGALRLEVLWPGATKPPRQENERSLVARVVLDSGSVLLTSDIGRTTEGHLGRTTRLTCRVLVIPHHGSRGGSSPALLDAAGPIIALVPAAPGNFHGHPHADVMARLSHRHIITRMPTEGEACGARWDGRRWLAFP